jgi:hypothetical protein
LNFLIFATASPDGPIAPLFREPDILTGELTAERKINHSIPKGAFQKAILLRFPLSPGDASCKPTRICPGIPIRIADLLGADSADHGGQCDPDRSLCTTAIAMTSRDRDYRPSRGPCQSDRSPDPSFGLIVSSRAGSASQPSRTPPWGVILFPAELPSQLLSKRCSSSLLGDAAGLTQAASDSGF